MCAPLELSPTSAIRLGFLCQPLVLCHLARRMVGGVALIWHMRLLFISLEQMAFLPLRYILDNILLSKESLRWAAKSNQPTVFLKLHYSKAYDKVDHQFLFAILKRIGLPLYLNDLIKILFTGASTKICVNNIPTAEFPLNP